MLAALTLLLATADPSPAADAAAGFDPTGIPQDALAKLAASGKTPVGSTIAPDGKSGTIQLDGGPPQHWSPKYVISGSEMQQMIDGEKVVLLFFFSTNSDLITYCHEPGVEFETAVSELIEGDSTFSFGMVDLERYPLAGQEYGVKAGAQFEKPMIKLFKDGTPISYPAREVKAQGLLSWMALHTGPPTTALFDPKELDALVADADFPVIVGVFAGGSKAQSKTPSGIARGYYLNSAEQMRGVARYVEMSFKTANAAQLFAAKSPFQSSVCAYALVRPAKWVGKGEEPYVFSTDFKAMQKTVKSSAWPLVQPYTSSWVSRTSSAKKLAVALLLDMERQAKKFRYILKQLHKVILADGEARSTETHSQTTPPHLVPFAQTKPPSRRSDSRA